MSNGSTVPATPPPTVIDFDESEVEPIVAGAPSYDETVTSLALGSEAVPSSGENIYIEDVREEHDDVSGFVLPHVYDDVVGHYRSEVEPLPVVPSPYDGVTSHQPRSVAAGSQSTFPHSPYDSLIGYEGVQDRVTDLVPEADPVDSGAERRSGDYAGVTAAPQTPPPQRSVLEEIASWPWREALGRVPELRRMSREEREQIVADVFERSGARPETARTLATRYLDTAGQLGEALGATAGQALGGLAATAGRALGTRAVRAAPPSTPRRGSLTGARIGRSPPQGGAVGGSLAGERIGTRNPVHEYGISSRINRNQTIQRHEVLQNAWLEEHGFVTRRNVGRSRFNTVLELTPTQHAEVNELQRLAGLNDRNVLRNLSATEVIDRNLAILRRAGVPRQTRQLILEDVLELLPALGPRAFSAP
jgi:hypothetical protein